MKLEASGVCNVGLVRKQNQDSILICQDDARQLGVFLVADGMGGYADGEHASGAIAGGMRDWMRTLPDPGPEITTASLLLSARKKLAEINSYIWREWNQGQICGSTCSLLLIVKDGFGLLSVGDSRVYRRRGWRFELLTTDDTWENQSDVRRRYTADELRRHPNYGRLTQAVGSGAELFCNTQSGTVRKRDLFLLCSDGVYKMIPPQFLERKTRFCRKRPLDKVRDEIMDEVRRGGARDNASLILVRCGDD